MNFKNLRQYHSEFRRVDALRKKDKQEERLYTILSCVIGTDVFEQLQVTSTIELLDVDRLHNVFALLVN